ncbi:MAG TPA: rhodanese-like domain-containing protein [Byssovorax sp.]|jgi:hypothetical protein
MKHRIPHAIAAIAALSALTACSSKEPAQASASASGAASATPHAAAEHELAELTVDEVEAKIAKNDGHVFVYDNNNDDMYASGHVPGAKHLAISEIPASAFPVDKAATLIFYCANAH